MGRSSGGQSAISRVDVHDLGEYPAWSILRWRTGGRLGIMGPGLGRTDLVHP